jgi:Cof subfamily protein (haloacid dehalogenase superfamily)
MQKEPLLIALDLDGTLLSDTKQIGERTKLALAEARKQGHHVVIATGRPYRSSVGYYRALGLDSPIVNFNGALIHHPDRPEWGLYHSPMEKKIAHDVIKASEHFGAKNIMVEVMDDVFLSKHDQALIELFFDNETPVKQLPISLAHDPTSILIYPDQRESKKLLQHLAEQHAEVVEQRQWSAPWNVIEIIRLGINKAVGLQRICDYYKVPKNRVIAFGDENNDLEMLQFAGTGIAMGNATAEVKEVANFITATNQEEGIAQFLEKEVL